MPYLREEIQKNRHFSCCGAFRCPSCQLAIELPNGEIVKCEPISALQHIGPPGSGHYVTYLLHNGKWFVIDSNKAIREAKGKEDIGVCIRASPQFSLQTHEFYLVIFSVFTPKMRFS